MNLLENINPVAKVIALLLMTTPLLLSVDVTSGAVVLVITIVLSPLCGVGWVRLAKRSWPLLIAAPLAGISMALFGRPEGESYFHFGVFHITDNSITLAVAIVVRVLAIGLPVMVLTATIDPTELGDGLAQILHLPARFVLATVAAVRLIGLLRDDLSAIRRARRARGLADKNGPGYWLSLAFSVLVSALRRAGKLATAMEARGFNYANERVWARKSVLRVPDVLAMVIALGIGAGAIGIAVATGDFRFLGVS